MFSFKIGIATFDFGPLIVVFLIAIVCAVFNAIFLFKRNKRIVELCRAGEYKDSIALAEKQLNVYGRTFCGRTVQNKNTKAVVETIHECLAISYLGLGNDEQFIHNIEQISDEKLEKHLWYALFYLLKKDSAKFQTHYDSLSLRGASETILTYLSSIHKLQECEDADARATLTVLHSKLNVKLLQDISESFVER